jgi:2,4-didehydro-3-deoxy-L-rhamnonate hydrolase
VEDNGSKGKSADTFVPMGPFLAICGEIPHTNGLREWLKVNGVVCQSSSTSQMIFDVPALVSYVSQFMTLLPGDVISTGTPAGVELGMNPPQHRKAGHAMQLSMDRLEESRQLVVLPRLQ